jgi:hypothetical protein
MSRPLFCFFVVVAGVFFRSASLVTAKGNVIDYQSSEETMLETPPAHPWDIEVFKQL